VPALGYFDDGDVLEAAPMIRVGVGFGRDRVVGMPAFVDTGSDLCLFPSALTRGMESERGEPMATLEMADGRRVIAPIVYPSVTVGDIRETAVASAILRGAPAILGRSFLNRLDLRIVAARGLVRLQRLRGSRD
jgi:predicted aspartyl protease